LERLVREVLPVLGHVEPREHALPPVRLRPNEPRPREAAEDQRAEQIAEARPGNEEKRKREEQEHERAAEIRLLQAEQHENACHEELRELNRGVGFLMGEPNLETAANPLAPTTIVAAFTEALHGIKGDRRIKIAILKELNQTSFGDIAAIYADVNRHLEGMNVVPQLRPAAVQRGVGGHGGRGADDKTDGSTPPQGGGEVDLMAMLQRLVSSRMGQQGAAAPMPAGLPSGGIQVPDAGPPAAHEPGQALSMQALVSALGMMANTGERSRGSLRPVRRTAHPGDP
jgi:hypothetical protein